jgi:putative transcriptional regulator
MKTVCPNCASGKLAVRRPDTYRYREAGLDGIILRGGVTEIECATCGDAFVHVEKEQQLLQVIALALLMKPGHLTGRELRYLRREMELSQADLAKALGVRRETVAERESKKDPALKADSEFYSRVVLLKSFLEYLHTEGNDHLGPRHREGLSRFCDDLLKLTERVQSQRQKTLLHIRQVADDWRPESPELVSAF